MRITRLEAVRFRNYDRLTAEIDPYLTVFVGPNAAGKTNLMEAARLLTATVPLRRARTADLVKRGQDSGFAALEAEQGKRRLEIRMDITESGRRSYSVNGQSKRSSAEVVGLLPSVAFTPDDLVIVKGPAESRRHAIDDVGEQLSQTYGVLRRDYARVVRHRNQLLREPGGAVELEVWDEQAALLGGRLLTHRVRLLARLMAAAAAAYAAMSAGEELSFGYEDKCGLEQGWTPETIDAEEATDAIRARIRARLADEQRRGVSLVGPHRDEIIFSIDGRDARSYASQGQQRTIALALKLAEVAVVEEVLRRKPILLLDDVMSELDESRREALSRLVASEVQTIITTTNLGYFGPEMIERARIVQLPELVRAAVRDDEGELSQAGGGA